MFQLNNDIQSLTTQVNLLSANISRTSTTLTEQIRALDKFQKFSFFVSQPKYPADFNQIKQDFWDTYPKAVGALRTHQKKCTQLLASLKEISDKIGVKFWLHGGTLVGAIRHHGFVPWDDDIDVAMMRHDYEKLEKELGKSDDYQILKFYDVGLGCRCYRFSLPKDDFQQYFIDIFVYDNCQIEVDNAGDEWERRKSLHLQLQKQMALLSTNYYTHADIVSKEDAEKFDALFTSFIDKTLENTSHGTDYVCWGIENNFENPSRPAWKIGRIYERADLFPLQKVTFENLTLLTPHRADRFIYAEYGGDVFDIPSDMGCSKHDSVK